MNQQTDKQIRCSLAAKRYACVLYDLGISFKSIEETKEIFKKVPQLQFIFKNPTISGEKKLNIIDTVFPKETQNFLKVVCKYQRMDIIFEIFEAYENYCNMQRKFLNAKLSCVEPPSETQLDGMKKFLCKKYNMNDVHIEVKRDDSLIGGFILSVGDDEYDWSLKGRLKRLEQKLTWR